MMPCELQPQTHTTSHPTTWWRRRVHSAPLRDPTGVHLPCDRAGFIPARRVSARRPTHTPFVPIGSPHMSYGHLQLFPA